MAKKKATKKKTAPKQVVSNRRLEQFLSVIENSITSRADSIRKLLDTRRDINDDCGYPKSHELGIDHFWELYDREPVAARVVEVMPDETWKATPSVFETEDKKEETDFERAWKELGTTLNGESSFSPEDESHPAWEVLHRADRLSGIGSFGVILLGLSDGKEFQEPVVSGDLDLLYMSVFHEKQVTVDSVVDDKDDPRNGQPLMYSINLDDIESSSSRKVLPSKNTIKVHWTRVIHLADNRASNEVYGIPRQRPVFNRLLDLQKLHGGSAEMYWRGAFPGLALQTSPNLDLETVEIDDAALRDQIEQYMNTLQRYMRLEGMEAHMLSPTVVDPSNQIAVQIDAICIKLAIPKRIFMGSERGELASSQDANTWDKRVIHRQNRYVSPRVIAPFVDRLINLGVLPKPPKGFKISWSELSDQNHMEKTQIAEITVKALAAYVQGDVEDMIQPMDLLTRVFDFTQEEAQQILDATEEMLAERDIELDLPEEDEDDGKDNPPTKEEAGS